MMIDLFHNKIIKDTATEKFIESFHAVVVPMLQDKYQDSLEYVMMYEDYIADGLFYEGEWYYPLTVKLVGEDAIIFWIKWHVTKKTFRNSIPYAYIGGDTVDFTPADYVPSELVDKLQGRAIDYDRKAIKLSVEAVTDDPLLLVGKYSQTFIDELARQISCDITEKLGVRGFENTTMELQLVFAPGTYLEHTSENVTYRRLLLVERGCQARDFWVKWTRLEGEGGFSVSDRVNADNIKFTIGEDVASRIREKEYRFLAGANPNKYQSATGKRAVTEWRDIIKRAVKREELEKVATRTEIADHAANVFDSFAAIRDAAGKQTEPMHVPVIEPTAPSSDDILAALTRQVYTPVPETAPSVDDDITAMVKAVMGVSDSTTAEAPAVPVAEPVQETELETEPVQQTEPELEVEPEIEAEPEFEVQIELEAEEEEEYTDTPVEETVITPVFTPATATSTAPVNEPIAAVVGEYDRNGNDVFEITHKQMGGVLDFSGLDNSEESEEFAMGDVTFEEYERAVNESKKAEATVTVDTEALLRQREAEIRLEYETQARLKAEQEAERLRIAQEQLIEENARLVRLAKEEEKRRIREAEEARLKEEERQRELAEKQAAEELARLEAERVRAEKEALRISEERERERYAEAARMAVEEQKRVEAERQAKLEREKQEAFAKEQERLRLEEESRRAEMERRREEQQRREEEEKRRREEAAARARDVIVEKNLLLIFKQNFDPKITKRIGEIVQETIRRENKENVDIDISAKPNNSISFYLQFRLPNSEEKLLMSIINAIGNARIGITKISIE